MEKKIMLPQNFEETKLYCGPGYDDGNEILRNYCASCVKEDTCEITKGLRLAMGNNFPFWSKEFLTFNYKEDTLFNMCAVYQISQEKLPGITREYSDSVERMVNLKDRKLKLKR